jgi:hypothetical protein
MGPMFGPGRWSERPTSRTMGPRSDFSAACEIEWGTKKAKRKKNLVMEVASARSEEGKDPNKNKL